MKAKRYFAWVRRVEYTIFTEQRKYVHQKSIPHIYSTDFSSSYKGLVLFHHFVFARLDRGNIWPMRFALEWIDIESKEHRRACNPQWCQGAWESSIENKLCDYVFDAKSKPSAVCSLNSEAFCLANIFCGSKVYNWLLGEIALVLCMRILANSIEFSRSEYVKHGKSAIKLLRWVMRKAVESRCQFHCVTKHVCACLEMERANDKQYRAPSRSWCGGKSRI